MYKVTAYSFFVLPQEYFVETEGGAKELKAELKSQQYSVEVELIGEYDE